MEWGGGWEAKVHAIPCSRCETNSPFPDLAQGQLLLASTRIHIHAYTRQPLK